MEKINRKNQFRKVSATNNQKIEEDAEHWHKKKLKTRKRYYHLNHFVGFFRSAGTFVGQRWKEKDNHGLDLIWQRRFYNGCVTKNSI